MIRKRLAVLILAWLTLTIPGAVSSTQANSEEALPAQSVIAVNVAVPAIICQVGDKLRFVGDVPMQHNYDTFDLFIDGALVSQRTPTMGADHYDFTWTPPAAKTYTLQWVYSMQTGGKFTARRLLVIAADTAPFDFVTLPATAATDTSVTIHPQGDHPFSLSRVDVYFNEAAIASLTASPFSATLPIAAVAMPGECSVRFVAYDSAGRLYASRTRYIEIPQRVQIAIPQSVDLKADEDKTPLSVSVLPGIKVSSVSYLLAPPSSDEWQPLGESSDEPYSFSAEFSKYASGPYQIKAQVTSVSGTVYETPSTSFNIVNGPDDSRKAQIAKAQSDLDAKNAHAEAEVQASQAATDHVHSEKAANLRLFLPRPGYDEKIFRKQLADLAYYEPPPRRTGSVGTVTGLGVIETIDGFGDVVSQRGTTQTITALVRPGAGQVNFLAFSEDDARLSAEQAAEYCKSETSYTHWDWSKYDISVAFSDNSLCSVFHRRVSLIRWRLCPLRSMCLWIHPSP